MTIEPNTIDIWLIHLPTYFSQIDNLKAWLPSRARARAERFRFDKHRFPYIVSEAYLHWILSHYINQTTLPLILETGYYGKPYLPHSHVRFNMSRSHEYALYGVTLNHEIGVDIEFHHHRQYMDSIVQQQFTKIEHQQFAQLQSKQRLASFYQGWVCKEAIMKALGMGFYFSLQAFTVNMDPAKPVQLLDIQLPEHASASDWYLHSITGPASYSCALASPLKQPQFRYFNGEPITTRNYEKNAPHSGDTFHE